MKKTKIAPGSLVLPKKETVVLTPIDDIDSDWPEWSIGEVGVVLSLMEHKMYDSIFVLFSGGVGYCFTDEVRCVNE